MPSLGLILGAGGCVVVIGLAIAVWRRPRPIVPPTSRSTQSPVPARAPPFFEHPLLVNGGFVLTAALFFFGSEVWPRGRLLEDYGPNIAAEILGILVVILVVERLLRRQRERDLEPVRKVAMLRMRRELMKLVLLIVAMYKAAAPKGSPVYEEPDELLDAWAREVPNLDFLKQAPVTPPQTWLAHGSFTARELEARLSESADRHAEALGVNLVAVVEEFMGDHFMYLLKQGVLIGAADQATGFQRVALPLFTDSGGEGARLNNASVDLMKRMIAAFDALVDEPLSVPSSLWRDDVSPTWAEARLTGPPPPNTRQVTPA